MEDDAGTMLSVDEACRIVLAAFQPLPVRDAPLLEALDFVVAKDVRAAVDVPPFRNSAMDGFAVRAADTAEASEHAPVRLSVAGEIAAGQQPTAVLTPGTAIRIMTGAPLPAGADAVVRFEVTSAGRTVGPGGRLIDIFHPARISDHVRPAGEDIAAGTMVLTAGSVITPAAIGVLASLNQAVVPVHGRPRVAILSTGNEVVDLGCPLRPGEIRDSNGYLLAALVARAGGVPVRLGIAGDSAAAIERHLATAGDADLVLTSGGVSVGDYDVVKEVLRRSGEVEIWQVAMKPGKPLAFGRIGHTPLIGLPGNPLAAAVGFELFVRPALRHMLGRPAAPPMIEATLLEQIENPGNRQLFVPAALAFTDPGGAAVRPVGKRGAGILSSLLAANGLISLAAGRHVAELGTRVPVRLLDADGASFGRVDGAPA